MAYHATQYLPLVLKQYEWVDKIVVLNYRFPSVPVSSDNTEEIVSSFKHPNIVIKSGEGLQQHEIRNLGINLMQDCDAVFISDADEFIFKPDQDKIVRALAERSAECKPASYVACTIVDYNGDLYHALPQRSYYTTVAIAPRDVKFRRLRDAGNYGSCICLPEVVMHHLGFVFTPELMDWKANWEYKEEQHSKQELLNNWAVKREVTPPQELLEMLK